MREYPLGADADILFFLARSLDPVTGEGDHVTGLTGAEPAIYLAKGGAFALVNPAPEVTEIGRGWYSAALPGAEMSPAGEMLFLATAADADDCERTILVGTSAAQLAANTAAIAAHSAAIEANTIAVAANTAAVAANTAILVTASALLEWIKNFTRGKKVRTQTHFRVYHPAQPNTLIFESELKTAANETPKAMPLTAATIEEADTANYA